MSNAFLTLLLGRLWQDGTLEMCNAGHCPPLLVRGDEITPLAATGLRSRVSPWERKYFAE